MGKVVPAYVNFVPGRSALDPDVDELRLVRPASLLEHVEAPAVALDLKRDGQLDEQTEAPARTAVAGNKGLLDNVILCLKGCFQRGPQV